MMAASGGNLHYKGKIYQFELFKIEDIADCCINIDQFICSYTGETSPTAQEFFVMLNIHWQSATSDIDLDDILVFAFFVNRHFQSNFNLEGKPLKLILVESDVLFGECDGTGLSHQTPVVNCCRECGRRRCGGCGCAGCESSNCGCFNVDNQTTVDIWITDKLCFETKKCNSYNICVMWRESHVDTETIESKTLFWTEEEFPSHAEETLLKNCRNNNSNIDFFYRNSENELFLEKVMMRHDLKSKRLNLQQIEFGWCEMSEEETFSEDKFCSSFSFCNCNLKLTEVRDLHKTLQSKIFACVHELSHDVDIYPIDDRKMIQCLIKGQEGLLLLTVSEWNLHNTERFKEHFETFREERKYCGILQPKWFDVYLEAIANDVFCSILKVEMIQIKINCSESKLKNVQYKQEDMDCDIEYSEAFTNKEMVCRIQDSKCNIEHAEMVKLKEGFTHKRVRQISDCEKDADIDISAKTYHFESKENILKVENNKDKISVEDMKQILSSIDKKDINIEAAKNSKEINKKKYDKDHNSQKSDIETLQELLDMDSSSLSLRDIEVPVYFFPEPPVTRIANIPWRSLISESLRLRTFGRYPLGSPQSALKLAAEGFAYLGSGRDDAVICVFCVRSYQGWRVLDDIRAIHAQMSPDCPIVTGAHCRNIPLNRLFTTAPVKDESYLRYATQAMNDSNRPSVVAPSGTGLTLPSVRSDISVDSSPVAEATDSLTAPQTSDNCSRQSGRRTTSDSETPNPPSNTTSDTDTRSYENRTSDTVSNTTENGTENTGNTSNTGSGPTYRQLAIITERPKRIEYAQRSQRFNSFTDWPRGHHLKIEDLADAGFYFAGYGDCARCFFCGGGLRNWELNDNVWVEHARWFPRCAFIRQTRGQGFVDAVKRLNDSGTPDRNISLQDVLREQFGSSASNMPLELRVEPLESDAAVQAVVEMGYSKADVVEAAKSLRSGQEAVAADRIFNKLFDSGKPRGQSRGDASRSLNASGSTRRDQETMNALRQSIQSLRGQTKCKVCGVREVEVTILPCGHLCCCIECSAARDHCPICDAAIRGVVRTHIG